MHIRTIPEILKLQIKTIPTVSMLSFSRKHTRSFESQSLLSPTSSQDESDSSQNTIDTAAYCSKPRGICLSSKPIILILMWAMFVAALYCIAFGLSMILLFNLFSLHLSIMSLPFLVLYSCVALLNLFYPLNVFFLLMCALNYLSKLEFAFSLFYSLFDIFCTCFIP